MKQTQMYVCTFTALKQSLRRLCFYTGLSVILFTGGSTWAGKSPLGRNTPQAGTPPGRYTVSGRYPWAGTPQQVHPWASTHPSGRYTPQGRYTSSRNSSSGRYTPRQVHPAPPGQVPPWQVHPQACIPPVPVHAGIRSTSRQYASYWNAFLF